MSRVRYVFSLPPSSDSSFVQMRTLMLGIAGVVEAYGASRGGDSDDSRIQALLAALTNIPFLVPSGQSNVSATGGSLALVGTLSYAVSGILKSALGPFYMSGFYDSLALDSDELSQAQVRMSTGKPFAVIVLIMLAAAESVRSRGGVSLVLGSKVFTRSRAGGFSVGTQCSSFLLPREVLDNNSEVDRLREFLESVASTDVIAHGLSCFSNADG